MSASLSLLAILGALLVGAVSPGPSFVLVSRIAVTTSRRNGLAAALGMGLGGAAFAVLALLGLVSILSQAQWLYLALRLAGGLYLVVLGIRIWRGASGRLDLADGCVERPGSTFGALALGFVTQVANPKTAIVYASIFAALLPASTPGWLFLALPPLVFVLETSWYAVVAVAFSARGPRAVYLRAKTGIDRAAGVVMGVLGGRLIVEAVLPRA